MPLAVCQVNIKIARVFNYSGLRRTTKNLYLNPAGAGEVLYEDISTPGPTLRKNLILVLQTISNFWPRQCYRSVLSKRHGRSMEHPYGRV